MVKIGRTHLQDAVPLTVGQEWGGWAAQLAFAIAGVEHARGALYELAAGGTAVGTGLNAPKGFAEAIAAELAALTGYPFVTAPNKFMALGGLDAMVAAMAALRGVAVVLLKVANDVRWLGSGPRCGLGELVLPENEPGSSIMPGKVNPTQCEAMVMICTQVIGEDAAGRVRRRAGPVAAERDAPDRDQQLPAQRPHPGRRRRHVPPLSRSRATELNRPRIAELLDRSLMLVTALAPTVGYDKAAHIAHEAHVKGHHPAGGGAGVGCDRCGDVRPVVDARSMV